MASDDEGIATSTVGSSTSVDEASESSSGSIDEASESDAASESKGPRLSVELVPATCWSSNLRSELPRPAWDVLRRRSYRDAGYRCEVCGGRGPAHPVECHEQWSYDDAALVQRLVRMVALCPACHQVKHLGRAHAIGRGDQARAHLASVNGWDRAATDAYVDAVFAQWERRSTHDWQLDLEALTAYGVTPPAQTRMEPSTRIVLAGDEPERGQVIAHPELGLVTCVGIAGKEDTGVGPPLLDVLVRSATEDEVARAERHVDPDSPWLDPEFVEILLEQAEQAGMQ